MKSINNLILRALPATLLIGCGNESYKETIQNIPKKNKDLNIYKEKSIKRYDNNSIRRQSC